MSNPNNTYKVCIKLLEDHVRSDKHIKAIALFYKLKLKYVNGRVYNYSPARLENQIGVSAYLISKFVGLLQEMGLVAVVKGYDKKAHKEIKVLKLCSTLSITREYRQRFRLKVQLYKDEKLNEYVYRLKTVCLEQYFRQQQRMITCKIDQKLMAENGKKFSLKKIKAIRRTLKQKGEELNSDLMLSAKKAFKKFGINHGDFKKFRDFTSDKIGWQWYMKSDTIECPLDYVQGFIKRPSKYVYSYWYKGNIISCWPTHVRWQSVFKYAD